MIVASGSANQPLARAICDQLEIQLCKVYLRRFDDGEIFVEIKETVRGEDVFVFQPASVPAITSAVMIMIDALAEFGWAHHGGNSLLRLRSAGSQNHIAFYISVTVANLIETAGADRVLTRTCTPVKFRAFSIFRLTIFTLRPVCAGYCDAWQILAI